MIMNSSARSRKRRTLKLCGIETHNTFREFGEVTTLHGLRYITEPHTSSFEKICWVLALISCMIWCGVEVYRVHSKWKENPVITSVAQKPVLVSEIPFPAVTICPETKILRSKINVEEKFEEIWTYLYNYTANNDTELGKEYLIYEAAGLFCDPSAYGEAFPDFLPSIEGIKLAAEIAPRIDDVFEHCSFYFENINCSKLFRPILTNAGLCFVFNVLNDTELFTDSINVDLLSEYIPWSEYEQPVNKEYPRRVYKNLGPTSGLSVILKLDVEETQDFCSSSDSENFRFTLHSPYEFPLQHRNYFHVSPQTHLMVSVQPEMTQTEPEVRPPKYNPIIRGCSFPEEIKTFAFKASTRNNALIDTIVSKLVKNCYCAPFFYPFIDGDSALEFCTRMVSCNTSTDIEAEPHELIPGCDELKYKHKITNAKHKHNYKNDTNHYSKVTIYFEDEQFLPWKKSELFGFTDLLASCGGLLGLFTGFSIITAIEILYFTSLRFICRLRERSKLRRDSSIYLSDLETLKRQNVSDIK